MSKIVSRGHDAFGEAWRAEFEAMLQTMFSGNGESLRNAASGYLKFSLDAMRLQKQFEKDRTYQFTSYDTARAAVYDNAEYMNGLYLPGILISHFLWPHHYRQSRFFRKEFLPRVQNAGNIRFCDVGVGTGFYSHFLLSEAPHAMGDGFDISPHSLDFAARMMAAAGFSGRWTPHKRDIVADTPGEQWPFLLCVEVLEHLEDPLTFLKTLRKMLQNGGSGFVTAAITAPNEDHIYLYNNCEEVIAQLHAAGFSIDTYFEDAAYSPRKDEPVPRLGAFIVR
ncbi:MAG: class I SAM-dependent methyltransferase [Nitrospinae bacterium]|nr:class I SAM-dependent methyltransferase [Nitrospinota bacterium]